MPSSCPRILESTKEYYFNTIFANNYSVFQFIDIYFNVLPQNHVALASPSIEHLFDILLNILLNKY